MSVRLFVCLVFIAEIVASEYEYTNSIDDEQTPRILVTDSLNDSPNGAAQIINIKENKTTTTGINVTVIPITTEQDKNGTVTKKPNADKDRLEAQSSQVVNSFPPYSSYEVTENVIDIPDDRTPAGPIVPDYTHFPPALNLARPVNKTATNKTKKENTKTKKNHVSIFHFNAEFEDKMHEEEENKVAKLFKGIKDYIHSFQKKIVNGFHSLFHDHHDEDLGGTLGRAIGKEDGHVESDSVHDVDVDDYEDDVHRRR
ncbi:hypothetical protein PYW08_007952 [Mythimna loreyi]|uniref:Uncharacterized protein n=1 Tax=Mythimna loreyi TaxID=667449 RepID=A0ACC2QCQ5_9NEOP|nr:hypothetical protein PYW08_007952 [Mythimna loreyi]